VTPGRGSTDLGSHTVLHLTLANLRAKPGRFIATMLAIIVGTGFLAGTLVLSDSLGPALESNAVEALRGVDAAVQPKLDTGSRRGNDNLSSSSLPATLLPTVRASSGVAAAAGTLSAQLNVLGPNGTVPLKHADGSLWIPVPALSPFTIVTGKAPTAAGQIAIDQQTANDKHWGVGTNLQLATSSGVRRATVVGISRYGHGQASSVNGDILVNPVDAFDFLSSGRALYDSIYVQGRPGLSQTALATSLGVSVGPQFQVRTGDDLRTEAAGNAAQVVDFLGTALQIFAWVALGVGVLIIYNTFAIVVAQRVREFALLRAIGARGSQVRRAVMIEALVVGVVASAIGMLVGIGLFALVVALVPVLKNLTGSSGVGIQIHVTTVAEVLIVGTVVTVISAVVPAFRAARTKPIAALRIAAVDRSGTSKARGIVGVTIIGLGAVILLIGMGPATGALKGLLVGFGPVLLFLGTLIAGPVLARGFASAVGLVLGRLGMSSRLAVSNAKRNPSRTANTANALIIGMFLVVFVTAAGGAIRDWAVKEVSQFSTADLTVTSTVARGGSAAGSGAGINAPLQAKIQRTQGVAASVALYNQIGQAGQFEIPASQGGGGGTGGFSDRVAAGDFAKVASVLKVKSAQGDLATLTDDQVAVPEDPGEASRGYQGPPLGSRVAITFKNGVTRTFTVGAVTKFSLDVNSYLVSDRAALRADPQLLPNTIAITVAPGQLDQVKDRLDDVTAAYSTVDVQPGNEIALLIKSFFNFIISFVNALLAFAIAIAVFGIVNTLILSVTERTPEIGLLRSVGMTRRQLRTTIRAESIVLAADGTVVGMIFGLFVAWAVTQPLFTGGESFSWPVEELCVIALIGLAIGLVASLIPAWRAARIDILDAVSAE
jgi:putative ABC transport system permease protein